MKSLFTLSTFSISFFVFLFFFSIISKNQLRAEGSKDFVNYPGHRMFLDTRDPQQLKVYANEGETINVGSSHVGIQGGFIAVYDPDGNQVALFGDFGATTGFAIINDSLQEANGPIGGGTTNGAGYIPGAIDVPTGQTGIWTVVFDYPTYVNTRFSNLLNSDFWTRANDQPHTSRAILAWDITVTIGGAGNMGGQPVEGRVYSNEHISLVQDNTSPGDTVNVSPTFYVLTQDGYIYQVDISEADPYRFPISSNSLGLVDGLRNPIYQSRPEDDFTRSEDILSWLPNNFYLYEPQVRDIGPLINNKIFFNPPDPNLPSSASVTDIFRNSTYATWLLNDLEVLEVEDFYLTGEGAGGNPCQPNTLEFAQGGSFIFETNLGGVATLLLDLNNNGLFDDPVDVILEGAINQGIDQLFWDGNDGLGNPVPVQQGFVINYQGSIKFGELHIALTDVEGIEGGVAFEWLNAPSGFTTDQFYYDHTWIGGPVSGGGQTGHALPTNIPYTYPLDEGNNDYIDHWMLISTPIQPGSFTIDISPDCFSNNPEIEIETTSEAFDRPIEITNCGDERLFVAEQGGKIWFLDADSNKATTPYLDLTAIIGLQPEELGLLGMTFHPDYLNNGFFYINYTFFSGDAYFSRISRFSVSNADPDLADPNSEFILLEQGQPFLDNNGGGLKFGADGYLYIGFGDGGSAGDLQKNAQNTATVLGKILRIDVDNGTPYSIPSDNPFVGDPDVLDEIWAIGLRNPRRFSFDQATGDLWIGDEGQDAWEEINRQLSNSSGGENYGWRCYEGTHDYNTAGCASQNAMTFPEFEYPHFFTTGCRVVGGFVYRGCEFPGLYGQYIFVDYCSGRLWRMVRDASGQWQADELADMNNNNLKTMGENSQGELFLAGHTDGKIYKVTSTFPMLSVIPAGCDNQGGENISFNIPTDQLSNPIWSDGSNEMERSGLAPGTYSVTVTNARGCTFTESIEIENTNAISVELTVLNNLACHGENNGGALAEVTGGTPPLTYVWDNGETTANAIQLSSGTHTVTVTDATGCETTAEVDIQEPSPIVVESINKVDISCFGLSNGSANITVSGGTSPLNVVWNNGNTGPQIDNLSTGTYTANITDANGCEMTAEIDVLEPSPIVVDSVGISDASCFGDADGSINASVSGGTPPLDISWDNGETGSQLENLTGGTYIANIIDANGCTLPIEAIVGQPDQIFIDSIDIDHISCFGETDGNISIVPGGGSGNLEVFWPLIDNGFYGSVVDSLPQGYYKLIILDSTTGCQRPEVINIQEPDSLESSVSSLINPSCAGNSNGLISLDINGGTPVYQINWSNGDTGPFILNLSAGIYTATVTDANSCTSTVEATMSAPSPIVIDIVNSEGPKCGNPNAGDGSITISVSGGGPDYQINWSNGDTGETADSLSAGIHSVTVTDNFGCERSFDFAITAPPPIIPGQTIEDVSCAGASDGSITLTPTGGVPDYTYVWENGETGPTIDSLASGQYTATITDAGGCEFTHTILVSEPAPLIASSISSTPDTLMQGTGTASIFPGGGNFNYSYEWSTVPVQTTQTATNLTAGDYTVTVTDAKGCELIETIMVDLFTDTKEIMIGKNAVQVKVFPNPITDSPVFVFIDGKIDIGAKVRLTTMLGQHLSTGQVMPNTHKSTLSFDLSGYPAGMYLLSIETEAGGSWLAGKVIKY
ncbi:MAG: PQQ-dependent sugar dehydrogenase [Bacteroidota bacterium]